MLASPIWWPRESTGASEHSPSVCLSLSKLCPTSRLSLPHAYLGAFVFPMLSLWELRHCMVGCCTGDALRMHAMDHAVLHVYGAVRPCPILSAPCDGRGAISCSVSCSLFSCCSCRSWLCGVCCICQRSVVTTPSPRPGRGVRRAPQPRGAARMKILCCRHPRAVKIGSPVRISLLLSCLLI